MLKIIQQNMSTLMITSSFPFWNFPLLQRINFIMHSVADQVFVKPEALKIAICTICGMLSTK